MVYTGQGGNDPRTKRQIADQQLTCGNLGLARSQIDGNQCGWSEAPVEIGRTLPQGRPPI
ncbi:YDG/SRA domain-containing protein [Micromonospora sp. BL4]|uniref:YDG/SRA domain-containing protein n=1 Tax=Micromonospora sp. BL4 TaxID=2478710 RepID=UPI002102F130|nr:YDG/SRA domain-containing protein [Micromonospora sp. BL4]